MNNYKEIGIFELSVILNKYIYFIISFTILFTTIITINYYFNNVNLHKVKTKIDFIKPLERGVIENIVHYKDDNIPSRSDVVINEIDSYIYELLSLYLQYYLINENNLNSNFLISYKENLNYLSQETLHEVDYFTFVPFFLNNFNDFDQFKYYFQKNGIQDDLLIKIIFNNLDYKLTNDGQIAYSNFFLNYKINDDFSIKLENAYNNFIDTLNKKIHNIHLTILLNELEKYESFLEKRSVFFNKLNSYYLTDEEVNNIIEENFFKKKFYHSYLTKDQLVNEFMGAAVKIKTKINFSKKQFEKVRKLNKIFIDAVKKEMSKENFTISAKGDIKIFDSSERENILKDTLVVAAICLFFGFILSIFISFIFYIKKIYISKK